MRSTRIGCCPLPSLVSLSVVVGTSVDADGAGVVLVGAGVDAVGAGAVGAGAGVDVSP